MLLSKALGSAMSSNWRPQPGRLGARDKGIWGVAFLLKFVSASEGEGLLGIFEFCGDLGFPEHVRTIKGGPGFSGLRGL